MRNRHLRYQDLCDLRENMLYNFLKVLKISKFSKISLIFLIGSFLFDYEISFAEISPQVMQKSPVIGIVDLAKIASQSKAGRAIETQVAEKNQKSKEELSDLESKIKSMESNKSSVSDSRKIEELQLILYDMVKEKRSQIAEGYRKAIETLETIVKESVKEVAEELGISVVLVSDAVVFSGTGSRDITEVAMQRLDQKCEYIEVITIDTVDKIND